MRLDARYTLKLDTGDYVYIRSNGIYSPDSTISRDGQSSPANVTQDQADWFTRLQFEASGEYDWMNYIFAVGVLTMHESRIIIDAYQITNSTKSCEEARL
jgi:hypothetical protein